VDSTGIQVVPDRSIASAIQARVNVMNKALPLACAAATALFCVV